MTFLAALLTRLTAPMMAFTIAPPMSSPSNWRSMAWATTFADSTSGAKAFPARATASMMALYRSSPRPVASPRKS